MAVTSIWAVKSNVSGVIDYARNPDKTICSVYFEDPHSSESPSDILERPNSFSSFDAVINYAVNGEKTEERKFVSCINCISEETAAQEFMDVKRLWGKTDGRLCFHGYQSFAEGEVDADTAHDIGMELANKLWGDQFQVVVATHCNTNCFHNHFVLNSVSMIDGHHFVNSKADYWAMRQASDEICRNRGLSVIQNPRGNGKNYAEYSAEANKRPTFRGTIREDIDRAVAASLTREEFFRNLQDAGYQLQLYRKDGSPLERPGLKPPGGKRFFRFYKLGASYDLPEIEKRIWSNIHAKVPFPEAERQEVRKYRASNPPPFFPLGKKPRLYRLYLRYCYELHIIEKHPASVRRVSSHLREDLTRLERLDAQTRMLSEHQISSVEDLTSHKTDIARKMEELTEKRKTCRNQQQSQRKKDPDAAEAARAEVGELTRQLRELRKELKLCDEVALRSARTLEELQLLLQELEPEQGHVTAVEGRTKRTHER